MLNTLFRKSELSRFLFFVVGGYFIWLLLYELVILPFTKIDEYLIHFLVQLSAKILCFFGNVITLNEGSFSHTIVMDGKYSVFVSPNCDALSVVAVFIIVTLSFSGRKKALLYFIPFGAMVIETINLLRIVGLSLIHRFYPGWLKFNHDYTFTIVVYAVVILLWWWWFQKMNVKLKL